MGLRHSKVEQESRSLDHENRLLCIFEHAFAYFQLEDWAKILSISVGFMDAVTQSPRLFILIVKKYYLSKDHVHPKTRRYFKILLTKRPRIIDSNLSGVAKEMFLFAEYRINISKNLIRDVYCVKMKNRILEIGEDYQGRKVVKQNSRDPLIERTHKGDGWLLQHEEIPEFRKGTLISSYGLCVTTYRAFFKQFSADFLQDFKTGRTAIKAGCFISRRQDCAAHGGCVFAIIDSESKVIFQVKQHKNSEEIPTSWGSNFAYTEIAIQITCKDLPENVDLERCEMNLVIYGQDRRFWRGHYGSRFSAMYIRGDFVENPLHKILN